MKQHTVCIEFIIDLPNETNIYDYVQDVLFQDEAIKSGQVEMATVIYLEEIG